MPTCYLLAVAQGSSLDGNKNTWSLFNLIEGVKVEVVGEGPFVAPVETHCYWALAPDEIGAEFEWRLVLEPESGGSELSHTVTSSTDKRRLRVKVQGLSIATSGRTWLGVEWRKPGDDDWHRCPITWPLDVEIKRVEGTVHQGENPEAGTISDTTGSA